VLWARDGRFERVVEVLVEAGVTCVDFTLTSRGAVEALPGAFTPTDFLRAWRAGADAVKFVPGLGRRAGVPAGGQGTAAKVALVPTGGSGRRKSGAASTLARLPSGSAARRWTTPGRAGIWGRCSGPRRPPPKSARPTRHDG
jgi:hypothetical protein